MSLREWLLFLHIFFAVVWLGGAMMIQVFGFLTSRSDDPEDRIRFLRNTNFVSRYVFNAAGIATFAFGLWLVIRSDVFGFDDWWVSSAMAVVILSAILGMAFFGPQGRKVLDLAAVNGPADAGVVAGLRRIIVVSQLETLLLVVVLWLMVFKPGS